MKTSLDCMFLLRRQMLSVLERTNKDSASVSTDMTSFNPLETLARCYYLHFTDGEAKCIMTSD
jgi:hypothetical protein